MPETPVSLNELMPQDLLLPLVAQAFAADLERLYSGLSAIDSEVIVSASRQGQAQLSAQLNMDDGQLNRVLLQVCRVSYGTK